MSNAANNNAFDDKTIPGEPVPMAQLSAEALAVRDEWERLSMEFVRLAGAGELDYYQHCEMLARIDEIEATAVFAEQLREAK